MASLWFRSWGEGRSASCPVKKLQVDEQMEYGVNNNYELESRFPWQSEFVFVDSLPFRADAIFIRNELKVKFLEDMEDANRPGYALVFCRVPRRDKALFLKSMADLDRAMLLEGNTDYREVSKEIIEIVRGLG